MGNSGKRREPKRKKRARYFVHFQTPLSRVEPWPHPRLFHLQRRIVGDAKGLGVFIHISHSLRVPVLDRLSRIRVVSSYLPIIAHVTYRVYYQIRSILLTTSYNISQPTSKQVHPEWADLYVQNIHTYLCHEVVHSAIARWKRQRGKSWSFYGG